ncbi:ABC transporter permease [Streptomyces sp. NPDC048664]|uniref:ABC transporter permease n=1 Tax=Streptomyces sp. NPDC048664 TaxID=3154505 RepID=UPI00343D69CE
MTDLAPRHVPAPGRPAGDLAPDPTPSGRPSPRARLRAAARQVAYGALASYQDYRAMFTLRTWLFGWTVRLICQVLFFAGLGRLVGSPAAEAHLAFGNAAILGPLGALGVVSSTVGERVSGTLQFLLLSRGSTFLVLASRGLHWMADGLLTSTIALCVVCPLLGVPLHWAALPVILAVLALSTLSCYCLALCMTSISVRRPGSRMYLTAGTTIVLMLLSGVTTAVPGTGVAGFLARILPLTHGLTAARTLAAGGPLDWGAVAGEVAVTAGWGVLAWLLLTRALRHTVRTGSLSLR